MRDDGVSTVLGAVLIIGLISVSFFTWSVTQLPDWIEENEIERYRDARTAVDAFLDDLESDGNARQSFPLGAASVPLFQPTASAGAVFLRDGEEIRFNGTANTTVQAGKIVGNPLLAGEGILLAAATEIRDLLVELQSNLTAADGQITYSLNWPESNLSVNLTRYAPGVWTNCEAGGFGESVEQAGRVLFERIVQCGTGLLPVKLTWEPLDVLTRASAELADTNQLVGSVVALNATHTVRAGIYYNTANGTATKGVTGRPTTLAEVHLGKSLCFKGVDLEAAQQSICSSQGGVTREERGGTALLGQPTISTDESGLRLHLQSLLFTGDASISGTGTATVAGNVVTEHSATYKLDTNCVITLRGPTMRATGDQLTTEWNGTVQSSIYQLDLLADGFTLTTLVPGVTFSSSIKVAELTVGP